MKRKILAFLLLLALLGAMAVLPLGDAFAEEATVISEPTPSIPHYDPAMTDYDGWVTANGRLYYLRDGIALTGLRFLDGKYYYFDASGVKAQALGVDVSTYNENIDWERVRKQGIDFAIIRVGGRGWTSGSIYADLRCEGYLRNARKAGLRIGVYFYSTAVNEDEAAREADAVLAVLQGRRLDLPVYYDVELSGEFPEGRADRLSAPERTRLARTFCRRIESAGYRAGVYSGAYFLYDSINYQPLSGDPIWLASYTADGLPPRFPGPYQIWQFSDHRSVDGISCGVDMNVMFSPIP